MLLFCAVNCTTTQKKTAYNTLYSLELTTTASYQGYLTSVVKGTIPTNNVPKVSAVYNKFQLGMTEAVTVAQFNWTNLAPATVVGLASDVLNAILEAKGK